MIDYIKLAVAAALLGVGFAAGSGWQKSTTAQVRQDFADYRAQQARLDADARAQALTAERAATAREQALQATIDQLDQDARHAETARLAARADADRAAERLRTAIATINYLGNSPDPAAPAARQRAGEPGASALDLLADLLGRRSSELVAISGYADDLADAGLSCERRYDAARAALADQS